MNGDCWICDRPILPPVEIIGQFAAHTVRVAHRRCAQALGELELDLKRAELAASGPAGGTGPEAA